MFRSLALSEGITEVSSAAEISGKSIDRFFSIIGILRIVSETDKFRDWLFEHHGIRKEHDKFFPGFIVLSTC